MTSPTTPVRSQAAPDKDDKESFSYPSLPSDVGTDVDSGSADDWSISERSSKDGTDAGAQQT